jgi:hypothetical protein
MKKVIEMVETRSPSQLCGMEQRIQLEIVGLESSKIASHGGVNAKLLYLIQRLDFGNIYKQNSINKCYPSADTIGI